MSSSGISAPGRDSARRRHRAVGRQLAGHEGGAGIHSAIVVRGGPRPHWVGLPVRPAGRRRPYPSSRPRRSAGCVVGVDAADRPVSRAGQHGSRERGRGSRGDPGLHHAALGDAHCQVYPRRAPEPRGGPRAAAGIGGDRGPVHPPGVRLHGRTNRGRKRHAARRRPVVGRVHRPRARAPLAHDPAAVDALADADRRHRAGGGRDRRRSLFRTSAGRTNS